MPILVDFNQVMHSIIAIQPKKLKLDEDLTRHIILTCLRSYKMKFSKEYGELIICCDSKQYWRREIFPYYKAKRAEARNASSLNWPAIFEMLNKIKAEIDENFPYKYIEINRAEADDIIAVLTKYISENSFGNAEKILILSGDKDFIQLGNPSVKQYDPTRKRWITSENADVYLKEHIIRGDKGDGIPNVRSRDNFLISRNKHEKAPTISKSFIENFNLTICSDEINRNYLRNKQLIDLTCIPDDVIMKIINSYVSQISKSKSKLFNYFVKNNLKHLMTNINDF